MACLKLTYYQENQLNLKVVWRKPEPGKPVPRFTSVDPLAEKYPWQSTYVYAAGNPIRYIDWMGLGPLGADGLTDEEWMETSRPNSDSRMAREYRQQNLAIERDIAVLSNFVHGKFKQNPHATVGALMPGDWDGQGEGAKGGNGVSSLLGWSNNLITTAAYSATEIGGSMRLTKGGNLSLKYYASAWTGGSRARITTYNLTKLGKGVGYGTSTLGFGYGIYNFAVSDKSWGDYGQLGVSLLSSGFTLSGYTAPIGIGIGFIDVMGGFNSFYNFLNAQQQFYNSTGGIILPVNSNSTFIQLRKP
jgi:hypothetical protein